jgi:hypothetical protein
MPPRTSRPEHSVAMWGAPGSGKTTFLASLDIALSRQGSSWSLTGGNESSTGMLVKLTTSLADGRFPTATVGMDQFTWVLEQLPPHVDRRRLLRRGAAREPSRAVGLDLIDASGEIFSGQSARYREARGDLIGDLVRSRGIIFLFDPIREFNKGDAFQYTFGVLAELAGRMMDSPERISGRLPHYVAVCVTKFDEIRVLQTAEKLDLLSADPADRFSFPRVLDEDAQELLGYLCDISRSGNADLVVNALRARFLPTRIKFFVTSAIGFYVDPRHGGYDPDDYQNEVPDGREPGGTRIRGAVHPINVVEPMLWLARKLTGDTRDG